VPLLLEHVNILEVDEEHEIYARSSHKIRVVTLNRVKSAAKCRQRRIHSEGKLFVHSTSTDGIRVSKKNPSEPKSRENAFEILFVNLSFNRRSGMARGFSPRKLGRADHFARLTERDADITDQARRITMTNATCLALPVDGTPPSLASCITDSSQRLSL
jgi:hypothetical protein